LFPLQALSGRGVEVSEEDPEGEECATPRGDEECGVVGCMEPLGAGDGEEARGGEEPRPAVDEVGLEEFSGVKGDGAWDGDAEPKGGHLGPIGEGG